MNLIMAADTKKVFKDALTGKDLKWADEDQLERAVRVAKEAAEEAKRDIPGLQEALRAIREELTKRVSAAKLMAVGATDETSDMASGDKKLTNVEKSVLKVIVNYLPIKKPEKQMLLKVFFNVEKGKGISYLETDELQYARIVMVLLLSKQQKLVDKAIAKVKKNPSLDELDSEVIKSEFNALLKKGIRYCNYSLKKAGVDIKKLSKPVMKSQPSTKKTASVLSAREDVIEALALLESSKKHVLPPEAQFHKRVGKRHVYTFRDLFYWVDPETKEVTEVSLQKRDPWLMKKSFIEQFMSANTVESVWLDTAITYRTHHMPEAKAHALAAKLRKMRDVEVEVKKENGGYYVRASVKDTDPERKAALAKHIKDAFDSAAGRDVPLN